MADPVLPSQDSLKWALEERIVAARGKPRDEKETFPSLEDAEACLQLPDRKQWERMKRQYRRGTISLEELAYGGHPEDCPNRRFPTRAELGITESHLEIRRRNLSVCPGCGARLEYLCCFMAAEEEERILADREAYLLPRGSCCCPRCGTKILEDTVEEYEKNCKCCGRPVGQGKRSRMIVWGDGDEPRQWYCRTCFESGRTRDLE